MTICCVQFPYVRKKLVLHMILSRRVGERFGIIFIYKKTDTYEIWYRPKAALDQCFLAAG